MMKKVLGVVLAGGQSTRMGSDKALLPMQGHRMIDLVVKNILPACSEGVMVSGRSYGYPLMEDQNGLRGPMAGIAALVNIKSQADMFLVIPVDMPGFESSHAGLLINSFSQDFIHWNAAHFTECHMPLVFKNDQNFGSMITKWLMDRSNDSVKSFLQILRILKVSNTLAMKNLNFESDYDDFMMTLERSKGTNP